MQVVLVDKLVKTQIVECQAIAKWLFSAEMSSELTKYVQLMTNCYAYHSLLIFYFKIP